MANIVYAMEYCEKHGCELVEVTDKHFYVIENGTLCELNFD